MTRPRGARHRNGRRARDACRAAARSAQRVDARSSASTSSRRAAACAGRSSGASTRATAIGSPRSSTDFAPTVVAHFGVYEPASRMTPALRLGAHRVVHRRRRWARPRAPARSSTSCCAAASRCTARRARRASRSPTRTRCPRPTTPYGRILLAVEAAAKGLGRRHGVPVGALRVRARWSARTCRARSAGCCGSRSCRSARSSDPPFSLLHPDDARSAMVAAIDRRRRRSVQRRRPRRGDALAGGAPRRPRPVAGAARLVGSRSHGVRVRGRRARAARRRAHPPRLHRRRQPRPRRARSRTPRLRRRTCLRELFDWADVVAIARAGEQAA